MPPLLSACSAMVRALTSSQCCLQLIAVLLIRSSFVQDVGQYSNIKKCRFHIQIQVWELFCWLLYCFVTQNPFALYEASAAPLPVHRMCLLASRTHLVELRVVSSLTYRRRRISQLPLQPGAPSSLQGQHVVTDFIAFFHVFFEAESFLIYRICPKKLHQRSYRWNFCYLYL